MLRDLFGGQSLVGVGVVKEDNRLEVGIVSSPT